MDELKQKSMEVENSPMDLDKPIQKQSDPVTAEIETEQGKGIGLGVFALLFTFGLLVLNVFVFIIGFRFIGGTIGFLNEPTLGVQAPSMITEGIILLAVSIILIVLIRVFYKVSKKSSMKVRRLLRIVNGFSAIGDIGFSIAIICFIFGVVLLYAPPLRDALIGIINGSGL